ncbi:MAG: sigma-70 family RNA polymerase sigma factor [Acidobacteria bacterium]|nr:sigma-70 family RNA polymerase sigma factor [Acidobacteriota bacterium]
MIDEPMRANLFDEARHSEEALVRGLRTGDEGSLGVLYDRYATSVYSLVYKIVGDHTEAEDVVQDVFVQAWQRAARYDPSRGSLIAWLLVIARSRALDCLRARRARPDRYGVIDGASDQDGAWAEPFQYTAVLAAEQAVELQAALTALPLLQRLALEMAYYEGLTHAEIAGRLEQPLGTVKARIRLGIVKLRAAILGNPP